MSRLRLSMSSRARGHVLVLRPLFRIRNFIPRRCPRLACRPNFHQNAITRQPSPSRPCHPHSKPRTMTNSPPPSPQTPTAEACAALAELTVRIFTPCAIASVRKILADNPRISLSQHLHLLGKLVVKHVAFSLDDQVDYDHHARRKKSGATRTHSNRSSKPVSNASSRPAPSLKPVPKDDPVQDNSTLHATSASQLPNERCVNPDLLARPPVNVRLPSIGKRASYRDVAYMAVRDKKIVPAAVTVLDNGDDDDDDPRKSTTQTAATKPTKRLSIRISRTKAAPAEQLRKTNSGLVPPNEGCTDQSDLFPRADMSSCLQSDSMARMKLDAGKDGRARESRGIGPSPIGKFAQLRKLRLDKRGKIK